MKAMSRFAGAAIESGSRASGLVGHNSNGQQRDMKVAIGPSLRFFRMSVHPLSGSNFVKASM
jgi:hypothetical protein